MVFIIKNNNGNRVSQIMKSEEKKASLKTIIEALKGLTIKIEIKLDDLIFDEDAATIELKPNNVAKENSKGTQNVIPRPSLPIPTETNIATNEPRETKSTMRQSSPNMEHPKVSPQPLDIHQSVCEKKRPVPSVQINSNEAFRQKLIQSTKEIKETTETIKREPSPVVSQNLPSPVSVSDTMEMLPGQMEVRKKLGQPKLIKGQLKIGHVVQSYAIAISEDKPNLAFIPYDPSKLQLIVDSISEMSSKIETQPEVDNILVDDIVFAQSKDDDQWYRAIVEEVLGNSVKVYYFDWGISEVLECSRLRHLMALGLSEHPACAVKVIPKESKYSEQFKNMTNTFNIRIESYNDFTDSYSISVLEPLDMP